MVNMRSRDKRRSRARERKCRRSRRCKYRSRDEKTEIYPNYSKIQNNTKKEEKNDTGLVCDTTTGL